MRTQPDSFVGDVMRYESGNEDNYSQVTDFWVKVLKEDERNRLVENMANHMKNAVSFIQERAIANYTKVHPDFGQKLRAALKRVNQVQNKKKCKNCNGFCGGGLCVYPFPR